MMSTIPSDPSSPSSHGGRPRRGKRPPSDELGEKTPYELEIEREMKKLAAESRSACQKVNGESEYRTGQNTMNVILRGGSPRNRAAKSWSKPARAAQARREAPRKVPGVYPKELSSFAPMTLTRDRNMNARPGQGRRPQNRPSNDSDDSDEKKERSKARANATASAHVKRMSDARMAQANKPESGIRGQTTFVAGEKAEKEKKRRQPSMSMEQRNMLEDLANTKMERLQLEMRLAMQIQSNGFSRADHGSIKDTRGFGALFERSHRGEGREILVDKSKRKRKKARQQSPGPGSMGSDSENMSESDVSRDRSGGGSRSSSRSPSRAISSLSPPRKGGLSALTEDEGEEEEEVAPRTKAKAKAASSPRKGRKASSSRSSRMHLNLSDMKKGAPKSSPRLTPRSRAAARKQPASKTAAKDTKDKAKGTDIAFGKGAAKGKTADKSKTSDTTADKTTKGEKEKYRPPPRGSPQRSPRSAVSRQRRGSTSASPTKRRRPGKAHEHPPSRPGAPSATKCDVLQREEVRASQSWYSPAFSQWIPNEDSSDEEMHPQHVKVQLEKVRDPTRRVQVYNVLGSMQKMKKAMAGRADPRYGLDAPGYSPPDE